MNDSLRRAVESCKKLNYPQHLRELILVYNGKSNLANTEGLNIEDGVSLLREEKRNAYAARNKGITGASGELILFTDADCIVDQNWARELVIPFEHDNIAAVVGRVLAYAPHTALEYFGNEYIFRHSYQEFNYILAGNAAVRKEIFDKLQGFDERFISCGDIDFSLQLKKLGFVIYYQSRAVVYHRHRTTIKGLFRQYKSYGSGWWRLRDKWGPELRMYSYRKRTLVFFAYIVFAIWNIMLYILESKTIRRKAERFKYLYLATINAALIFGYVASRINSKLQYENCN